MERHDKTELADQDRSLHELLGVLREPGPAGRWTFARQCKTWRPPTDLHIALEAKELAISGIRQDSSAKVGYQQMEIQYGAFESHVSLPTAVDQDAVEATYLEGFLTVRLPKAQARRVQITYT